MIKTLLLGALSAALATTQSTSNASSIPVGNAPLSDPGTYGPSVEIVHLFYGYWASGIAVSSSGRKFTNYPAALVPENTNISVAELASNNTEVPFPSLEINSPPGGKINYTTNPPTGANYQDYFIGVQAVVMDPADRLWILDTGRAALPDGTMVPSSYGGPKLVGIDLKNNSIFSNIVFSTDAAPADSYFNDVRFDLNPNITASGKGVAYLTDSSAEGENALVIVDLGTKEAWRHLKNAPSVSATIGFVPTIWGETIYGNGTTGQPVGFLNFGADGIALSPDGNTLYWAATGGRNFWSIATERLRDTSSTSEIRANAGVNHISQHSLADGMDVDTNGYVYAGILEDNAIGIYFPENGTHQVFVRDPRFSWTDAVTVAADGYLYFTENQFSRSPPYNGGVEKRVKPYVLFRVKLPDNGTKVLQAAP